MLFMSSIHTHRSLMPLRKSWKFQSTPSMARRLIQNMQRQRTDPSKPIKPRKYLLAASRKKLQWMRWKLISANLVKSKKLWCWWINKRNAIEASDLSVLLTKMSLIVFVRFIFTPLRTRKLNAKKLNRKRLSHQRLNFNYRKDYYWVDWDWECRMAWLHHQEVELFYHNFQLIIHSHLM